MIQKENCNDKVLFQQNEYGGSADSGDENKTREFVAKTETKIHSVKPSML
jgi:hypothetical protein